MDCERGGTQVAAPGRTPARGRRETIAWSVTAVAAVVAAAGVLIGFGRRTAVVGVPQSHLLMPVLPAHEATGWMAITPDGTRVAFSAMSATAGGALFTRSLGDGAAQLIQAIRGGQSIQLGAPVGIFADTFLDKGSSHTGYDVSADGRRLVFSRESATTPRQYLDVLQGWLPELQRRVPMR
jgi:hypothetical protein